MKFTPQEVQESILKHNMKIDFVKRTDLVHGSLNLAPQTFGLIYHPSKDGDKFELEAMKWTLQPFYAKEPVKYPTFNTRAESLKPLKPAWRCAVQHRGVVFMQGYYEWRHDHGRKIPYYISRKDGELMCVLCIWDFNANFGDCPTFSIVTTTAAPQLQFIHPRMPVSADFETAKEWITGSWPQVIDKCIHSDPDLTSWEVETTINRVGATSSDLTKPVTKKKSISDFFKPIKREPKREEVQDRPEAVSEKIPAKSADGISARGEKEVIEQSTESSDSKYTSGKKRSSCEISTTEDEPAGKVSSTRGNTHFLHQRSPRA